MIVAVDPSINSSGLAFFCDGELCGTVRVLVKNDKSGTVNRAVEMARRLAGYIIAVQPLELVSEWPQAYRPTRSKGNPGDLFGMPTVLGALVAFLHSNAIAPTISTYLPFEWIRQIPKTSAHRDRFTSPRGAAISTRIRHTELAVFRAAGTHDEIDAIGIGLHHLGRGVLHRRR